MTTIQLRYKIEQDKVRRKTQWLCGGIFPRVIPSEDLFGQHPLVGGEKIFLVVFMESVFPQAAFASEV